MIHIHGARGGLLQCEVEYTYFSVGFDDVFLLERHLNAVVPSLVAHL